MTTRKKLFRVALVALAVVVACCLASVGTAQELDHYIYLPMVVSVVCDCSGNIYNCDDFRLQPHAQACFDYCVAQGVGDIHKLDADDDGMACEHLPGPDRPTAVPSPTIYFDPSTPVSTQPWVTLFPPFHTLTIVSTLTPEAP